MTNNQAIVRITELKNALRTAADALNETADRFLVGDEAKHLNGIAAECRRQIQR